MSRYDETMQKRVAQLRQVMDRMAAEDVPILHLADACQLVDERFVVEPSWDERNPDHVCFLGWRILKGKEQGRCYRAAARLFPTMRAAYVALARELLAAQVRGRQNMWPYFDVVTGAVETRTPHELAGKASPLKGRPSPLKGRTGAPRPRTLLAFMGRIERKRR